MFSATARGDTPAEIVDRLNREIAASLPIPRCGHSSPTWSHDACRSPADFGEQVTTESEKWGKVVKFARIRAE